MLRAFWDRGGWWVLGQALLMPVVAWLGLLYPGGWGEWASMALGVIFLSAGAALGIGGAVALGRSRTIFPKPREGSVFIRHGVYGLVRHPLYASLIFLGLGWGFYRASWPAILGTAVLMLFLDRKAAREEEWLRERYRGYADYAGRVKRLLPWIY